MKINHLFFAIFLLSSTVLCFAQTVKPNSDTRQFIDDADFTQVNRDWTVIADFKSGLGEVVSFFPVEAIDLKSNKSVRSMQMDMTVTNGNYNYFKSSWIDLNEVEEFIFFLEQYVVPNLKDKAENKQSVTYIFNSKEITFSFDIKKLNKRISIYLKDNGVEMKRIIFGLNHK